MKIPVAFRCLAAGTVCMLALLACVNAPEETDADRVAKALRCAAAYSESETGYVPDDCRADVEALSAEPARYRDELIHKLNDGNETEQEMAAILLTGDPSQETYEALAARLTKGTEVDDPFRATADTLLSFRDESMPQVTAVLAHLTAEQATFVLLKSSFRAVSGSEDALTLVKHLRSESEAGSFVPTAEFREGLKAFASSPHVVFDDQERQELGDLFRFFGVEARNEPEDDRG